MVHLNRPTAISIKGRTSHCDVGLRAGQKKATRGKAGCCVFVFASVKMRPLLLVADRGLNAFFLFLGVCAEEDVAIVTVTDG